MQENPKGKENGDGKVIRGGSCVFLSFILRRSVCCVEITSRHQLIEGFRVVMKGNRE